MKVLHINCNYIGTTLHQKMIEQLDLVGINSQVFVPTYDCQSSVIDVNENVTVAECFKKKDRFLFDYKQNKILNCVEKLYDLNNFDCVHAYTLFTDGNCAWKLKKKYGIPYVVAIRNTDVNCFFKYMIQLRRRGVRIMEEASAIFFLSESYKKQVFDKYIPKKYKLKLSKKSYVIPNGVDNFWFENLYLEKDFSNTLLRFKEKNIRILYVGRIDKNKNISLTLDAIKLLRKSGWLIEFTVIGKVKDKKEYLRIKENDFCTYLEARPKEQLIELYRNNDIFVMPSHQETFGLVYAEAMSQALPVIYTKFQGFDGQFPEGEVGYSVSSKDSIQLAQKIIDVVYRYDKISKKAVGLCEKFKWENIVDKYLMIYKKIESQ